MAPSLTDFFFQLLGVNLRTGRQGIFPSAYAVDMDYSDFDPSAPKVKRERYLLGYLGSVETLSHKGTSVVCQAVRRIVGNTSQSSPNSQSCILEVSDQGLRMVDRSKPPVSGKKILSRFNENRPQILQVPKLSNCLIFSEKSGPLSRLFLLVEERLFLCISSSRSSLPWLYHEASDFAKVCLSRVYWSRIYKTSC